MRSDLFTGGFIALKYAVKHPEKIGGTILLSPAGAPLTKLELAGVFYSDAQKYLYTHACL
jgi:pimeloyl-ACP methyl ester carboxylesterase